MLLDIGTDMLVADIGFLFNLEDLLSGLKPAELVSVDTMVPYIGGTSHVWLMDTLSREILSGCGQDQEVRLLILNKQCMDTYIYSESTDVLDISCLFTLMTELIHISRSSCYLF